MGNMNAESPDPRHRPPAPKIEKLLFCARSERADVGVGGDVSSGVLAAATTTTTTSLRQKRQGTIGGGGVLVGVRALHGVPSDGVRPKFLGGGQERRAVPVVRVLLRPAVLQEPKSPGQSHVHQPAEQRVQRLASVEVRPVLQDLHAEDPAADARLPAKPRQVWQ